MNHSHSKPVIDEISPEATIGRDSPLICKPFLKWVGGKRGLLNELVSRVPIDFGRYYEPFVGGGALFFTLLPSLATLSDVNPRLIVTYQAVKHHIDDLISLLQQHKLNHSSEYFQGVRSTLDEKTHVELAAAMIYLNKTCFNGLYRVNKSGKFNVPFGKYTNPAILDENNLLACHKALQNIDLQVASFDQITPDKGDFVYLDPPYDSTYSQYDDSGFNETKHKQLAEYCQQLSNKGVKFMLSNSDTLLIRDLYKPFNIIEVYAPRYVSCQASGRKKQQELLILNF